MPLSRTVAKQVECGDDTLEVVYWRSCAATLVARDEFAQALDAIDEDVSPSERNVAQNKAIAKLAYALSDSVDLDGQYIDHADPGLPTELYEAIILNAPPPFRGAG